MFRLMLMAFAFLTSSLLLEGDGDTEPGGSSTGENKGFGQEDLNRAAGSARREGRQAAINDLLKELEAEGLDEVKTGFKSFREAGKKLETLESRVARLTAERDALSVRGEAERQALALGANPERLAAVVRLREPGEGEIREDGEVDAGVVRASVEAVLSAYPEFKKGALSTVGGGSNPPKDDPKTLDEEITEAQDRGDWSEVLRLQTSKLLGK